ncbi:hypothetical protein BDZ91DRAFT_767006 [Kalaharituber pfeilii]|nr:hypothetical protein BDZ91DRAFT_767006 [Kalaharituber pfeilii]
MDIHSPTVAASSSSTTPSLGANATPTTKEELLELMEQKNVLEGCGDIVGLMGFVWLHKVTMGTPLTTSDGFPRDDIEVPQNRHLLVYAQLHTKKECTALLASPHIPSHLRNDYKAVMSHIEKGLHNAHLNSPPPLHRRLLPLPQLPNNARS